MLGIFFISVGFLILHWVYFYTQGASFCSRVFLLIHWCLYLYWAFFFYLSGFLLLPWAYYNHRGRSFYCSGYTFYCWELYTMCALFFGAFLHFYILGVYRRQWENPPWVFFILLAGRPSFCGLCYVLLFDVDRFYWLSFIECIGFLTLRMQRHR